MSVFKKSGEGFLARLFKHKKIDGLAEELAHTYADEMQENMLSENAETEQIPMLEVTKTGEVDFENQPENSEENSPLSTEKSEVRNHLIFFRVNDDELETIGKNL